MAGGCSPDRTCSFGRHRSRRPRAAVSRQSTAKISPRTLTPGLPRVPDDRQEPLDPTETLLAASGLQGRNPNRWPTPIAPHSATPPGCSEPAIPLGSYGAIVNPGKAIVNSVSSNDPESLRMTTPMSPPEHALLFTILAHRHHHLRLRPRQGLSTRRPAQQCQAQLHG